MSAAGPIHASETDPGRWLDAGPSSPLTAGQAAILAAVWALGSLLLLLIRPGYCFPPFELLDSWIYTSYQWDPRGQISDFGATYYGSRLSWILPGAFLHHFLPPIAAEICFKLGFSALLAAAVGMVVHAGLGIRWAIVGVATAVFCPPVVAALHADYSDTPVFTYAAATLACITLARHSRLWWLWIIAAGGSLALMAVANLGSLTSIGVGLGVFHLCWLRWPFRRHLATAALYGVGTVAIVCLLGNVQVYLGGRFHFLQPQIDMVLYFKNVAKNPWMPTNAHWVLAAPWLILPFATFLWGAWCSVVSDAGHSKPRPLLRSLTAALGASLGLATLFELRHMVSVLSLYYYASFHLALALPLLTLCCANTFQRLLRFGSAAALGAAVAVITLFAKPVGQWSCLSFLVSVLHHYEWIEVAGAAALVLAGVAAMLAALRFPKLGRPTAVALFLGLIMLSSPPGFHGREISDRLRERYAVVYKAYDVIARTFPPGSYIYWVHADERNGISLASTKLWGYRLLTLEPFPQLGTIQFIEKTVAERTIIVPAPIGRGQEVIGEGARALAAVGREMDSPRIIVVPGDAGLGFDLVCFTLRKLAIDPEYPAPGAKPAVMLLAYLAYGASPYTGALRAESNGETRPAELDSSRAYPAFQPSAPGERVATQFHLFAPPGNGQAREVSVLTIMPAAGNCLCTIQDEYFHQFAQFPLTKEGRSVHRFELPADATRLRVVFQGPPNASLALPTQIRFYEIPR